MLAMIAPLRLAYLLPLVGLTGLAQPPAATPADSPWPKQLTVNGDRIVIYQPQADTWNNNRLEARVAVMVTPPGRSAPAFGIVAITARTKPDAENRTAALEDLKISSVDFPSDAHLADEVRQTLPQWPRSMDVSKLRFDVAIGAAEKAGDSVPLKSDPPKVIFSTTPAVLVLIDGDPVLRRVRASHYSRVLNTPATLLFDPAAKQYYLDGETVWMTANNLNGPWTPASNPPADLDQVKAQLTQNDQKAPPSASAQTPAPQAGAPPAVYVSTTPAELLQTKGEPQYSPIAGTQLVYATNSDNDIFMDVKTQNYFTLLSGRWYRAASVQGPWSSVAGSDLPKDFSKIPANSPKASILASIPATPQAKAAAISNEVPQTATVRRSTAKLTVKYDGEPQFKPVDGTSLEYAVNTSTEVVRAQDHYYACHNAVWFVADSPLGPWAVADTIPAEIYKIPASSPLYHLRYVRVYGATPDYVYYGYTPGYLGAFVWGGVVVYGTGWYYPPWIGGFYYGWPWTWGFGYHFGWWGGGWLWHPAGFGFWYHGPGYMGRIYSWRSNPGWAGNQGAYVRNNVNVYNRWQRTSVTTNNYQSQRPAMAAAAHGPTGARPAQAATPGAKPAAQAHPASSPKGGGGRSPHPPARGGGGGRKE
jgi:hypothetical protein